MTQKTTLAQTCTTAADALGSIRFQIDNTVTVVAAGDLPTKCVFVYQLGTPNDPKSDTFLRVGTVQDITNTVIGREAALLTQKATYLAAGFTISYADIATAVTAKQLIQARVDQLIADWRLYSLSFSGDATVELPLQDASRVQAKKDAYAAAKVAKATADAAVVVASAALLEKTSAASLAAEKQLLYQTLSTQCSAVTTAVTGIVSAEATLRTAAQSFRAGVASAATLAEAQLLAASFAATLATADTTLHAPLLALQTTLTTDCASRQQAAVSAAGERATADAAIGAAQRTAILARQTAQTAQTAQESALAEALAICPSFDPATV